MKKKLVRGFEYDTGKLGIDGYPLVVLYALFDDGKCIISNEHREDSYFDHTARFWKECEKIPKCASYIGNYTAPDLNKIKKLTSKEKIDKTLNNSKIMEKMQQLVMHLAIISYDVPDEIQLMIYEAQSIKNKLEEITQD